MSEWIEDELARLTSNFCAIASGQPIELVYRAIGALLMYSGSLDGGSLPQADDFREPIARSIVRKLHQETEANGPEAAVILGMAVVLFADQAVRPGEDE